MIKYSYRDRRGQLVGGEAEHLRVRYDKEGVHVQVLEQNEVLEEVDVVDNLTPPSDHQTTKFVSDRFTIDGNMQ